MNIVHYLVDGTVDGDQHLLARSLADGVAEAQRSPLIRPNAGSEGLREGVGLFSQHANRRVLVDGPEIAVIGVRFRR